MNRWTKFKNDMVHTVRAESINKKQDYDKQLRRPVHMPVKMPIKTVKNEQKENLLKEADVLNTNYLASAEYIFKAAK